MLQNQYDILRSLRTITSGRSRRVVSCWSLFFVLLATLAGALVPLRGQTPAADSARRKEGPVVKNIQSVSSAILRDSIRVGVVLVDSTGQALPLNSGRMSLLPSDEPQSGLYEYHSYYLMLPDTVIQVQRLPMEVEIRNEMQEKMTIRFAGHLPGIPFRPGSYNIPARYAPLFFMNGLNGTHIYGQNLACFSVDDLLDEPDLPNYDSRAVRTASPSELSYLETSGYMQLTRNVFANVDSGWCMEYWPSDAATFSRHEFRQLSRVYRNGDGGQPWGLDVNLSDRAVFAIVPRDSIQLWLLGKEFLDDDDQNLRLYTASRKGENIEPVYWPPSFDSACQIRPDEQIVPIGTNALIVEKPGGSPLLISGLQKKRMTITPIDGTIVNWHIGPDGTTWIILKRGESGTTDSPLLFNWMKNHDTYLLMRSSPAGDVIEPVLSSYYILHDITFADRSTGVVVGQDFVLLTTDEGKNWRYLPPAELKVSFLEERYDPVYLQAARIEGNRLSLMYQWDVVDIDINHLPSPLDCAE